MEDPKRTPWQCTASVCVAEVYCWGISLGLGISRSRERDLPTALSIYPRILLCVFIVYRCVVRILCLLSYSAICWLLWFSCQYLPSDWLERPLWGHLNVVRRLPPQSPGGRVFVCIFLSFGLFMLLCVPPTGPAQYIFHTPMARYSLYVLKVPLNTKQTNWCILNGASSGSSMYRYNIQGWNNLRRLTASSGHGVASDLATVHVSRLSRCLSYCRSVRATGLKE